MDGTGRTRAEVWLASGEVQCSNLKLLERWAAEGVVGRGAMGRLHPAHGQAFLDELPFAYRGLDVRAVPQRGPR